MKCRQKKSYIYLTIALVSSSTSAYIVQKGDTLSRIAYREISTKVYGRMGSLEKLLTLNPQIKNQNTIFPGDEMECGRKTGGRVV